MCDPAESIQNGKCKSEEFLRMSKELYWFDHTTFLNTSYVELIPDITEQEQDVKQHT